MAGRRMGPARTKPRREVRIRFEPTRIAERCLADAYGRLVPLSRSRVLLDPDVDRGRGSAAPRERERREGPR